VDAGTLNKHFLTGFVELFDKKTEFNLNTLDRENGNSGCSKKIQF